MRLFYTIYQFDGSEVDSEDQDTTSKPAIPEPASVAGSTFHITDSVMVIDTVKSPTPPPTNKAVPPPDSIDGVNAPSPRSDDRSAGRNTQFSSYKPDVLQPTAAEELTHSSISRHTETSEGP